MKNITMIIPTRGRTEKLKRTLESIPPMQGLRIRIISDGDEDVMKLSNKPYPYPIQFELLSGHNGSVACRNFATPTEDDGLMCAMDDIEFQPGCIEAAFETFNKSFPDDDGVVGFVQMEHDFHPTWIALVGQKFLQRYPHKRMFYPGYFHFASQEIVDLCNSIGDKFVQCEAARVKHYHPGFMKHEMDETHKVARVKIQADKALRAQRIQENLIWGS